MRTRFFVSTLCGTALILVATVSAQTPRPNPTGPASSSQKSGGRAPARGPLPDPALLDGSTQPPEKKSEYGMLGDFELPGDENAKTDKVGGPQSPGAGQEDPKMAQGGAQGAGGQQPGGQPPKDGGKAGPAGGENDPNAKAEGIQVSELKTGEPGSQGAGPEGMAQKPQPVSIGDPAMQIKSVANAPGVVGAQVPTTNTQQMEKAVGGSAKGSPGDNGNRGSEKGRVMPSGL